jgi:hypothetical protein
MSLKEEGRVIAYSNVMPLEERILLPLLEDKIRERDIPLDAIKQWTDPRLSVYVASATVKSGKPLRPYMERLMYFSLLVLFSLNVNWNIVGLYPSVSHT